MARSAIHNFELANPLYKNAIVYFYTVAAGVKTSTLADLFASGNDSDTQQLANPQKLDSRGKLKQPVYIEEAVVATIDGISVPSHDTGIISIAPTFRVDVASTKKLQYSFDGGVSWKDTGLYFFRDRGAWLTATDYVLTDLVTEAGASYVCVTPHTSGVFATDLAAGKWVLLTSLDATLTSIAALTGAADKGIYFTGADAAALFDLTAAGRALLDDASASAMLTTLGLTTDGKALVSAANYAAMKALLDLEIGTDVSAATPPDNVFRIVGSGDSTKKVAFEVDGVTAGQTRTITVPDANLILAKQYDTVAAHATTCDPWGAEVVLLSGSAVTFTDLADADFIGQRVLLLMNAAHVWTDGAVFDVQGGATYTTAAGDWVELVATAVDAFDVTIFPALGQPVSMQPITASLGADVALNNTSNYFSGPAVAQGTAGKWFVSGTITCEDTAGAATFYAKLWDGTTVVASAASTSPAANNAISITLSGYISAPAGNLRIDARDTTSTSGQMRYNETGDAKDCTITAIRIA